MDDDRIRFCQDLLDILHQARLLNTKVCNSEVERAKAVRLRTGPTRPLPTPESSALQHHPRIAVPEAVLTYARESSDNKKEFRQLCSDAAWWFKRAGGFAAEMLALQQTIGDCLAADLDDLEVSFQHRILQLLDSLNAAGEKLTAPTWESALKGHGTSVQDRRARGPKPDVQRHLAILEALHQACHNREYTDFISNTCASLDQKGIPYSGKIIRAGSTRRNPKGGWIAEFRKNANEVRAKIRRSVKWADQTNVRVNDQIRNCLSIQQ